MANKHNANIVTRIRQLIRDELKGMYTATACIVEEVDSENRRLVVSLKSDDNVFVDNVPIASLFAGDGKGLVVPIEQDDEGVLLHLHEPFAEQIQESGHVEPEGQRRHTVEDAVFLPQLWLDDMDVPDHEDGELLIAMQDDGSALHMLPDGEVRVEHQSGNVIRMDPDGNVFLGDPDATAPVLTEDAILEYEDTGDSAEGGSGAEIKEVTVADPGSEHTEAS